MCYTSCVCPNFWYIVDVYGIYFCFWFKGSDTQFYPAAFETYSRSFGSSSRSVWLFSTSWSGREKEVLFAVWQELREEGGGKKNVQKCPGRTTVPRPAAAPAICFPSQSWGVFKTGQHVQGGKALLLGYKNIQEGRTLRNTYSSKQGWPVAELFYPLLRHLLVTMGGGRTVVWCSLTLPTVPRGCQKGLNLICII